MSLFCRDSITPYKAQRIDHETKFRDFMAWAASAEPSLPTTLAEDLQKADNVVQLVRRVNYGPIKSKSKRYFAPTPNGWKEVGEKDLINANFKKLNTYKNYRCQTHDRFFELNVYQKDPKQTHHWREDIDRPASDIDLQPGLRTTVDRLACTEGSNPAKVPTWRTCCELVEDVRDWT